MGVYQMIIWEGAFQGKPTRLWAENYPNHIVFTLEDTTSVVKPIMEGVLSFAKAHPFMTGWMAGMAWDAVKKYTEAKKKAMHLYAKDVSERPKHEAMIKELKKIGFTVVKHGYINGTGYHWELNKP